MVEPPEQDAAREVLEHDDELRIAIQGHTRPFGRVLRVPRYLAWRTRRLAKEQTRGLRIACRRCITTARLSASTPDWRGRLKIQAALPLLAIARRTGRRREMQLPLQVANRPLRIFVGDPSELEALYEVIVKDEYELFRASSQASSSTSVATSGHP